jgi:hypothetical protein
VPHSMQTNATAIMALALLDCFLFRLEDDLRLIITLSTRKVRIDIRNSIGD